MERDMMKQPGEDLRRAIESLINAKLHDALRRDGLPRLVAHRTTGVASFDIRTAERQLEHLLSRTLTSAEKKGDRKRQGRDG